VMRSCRGSDSIELLCFPGGEIRDTGEMIFQPTSEVLPNQTRRQAIVACGPFGMVQDPKKPSTLLQPHCCCQGGICKNSHLNLRLSVGLIMLSVYDHEDEYRG
jgi:hypothetical protein